MLLIWDENQRSPSGKMIPIEQKTGARHNCPNSTYVANPQVHDSPSQVRTVPQQQSSEPILKQNVGSGNSILMGLVQKIELYMETESTMLEKILERVMEKSTSSNVNSAANGVNIDKLAKQIDGLYDLEELNAAALQEIKKHFKISSFRQASKLAEEEEARQEDVEEMADTDDQTQLDSHSINHVQRQEE